MLPAIQLDRQFRLVAIKIHDVFAHRVLVPEFHSKQLPAANATPDLLLRIGRRLAKLTRSDNFERTPLTPALSRRERGEDSLSPRAGGRGLG